MTAAVVAALDVSSGITLTCQIQLVPTLAECHLPAAALFCWEQVLKNEGERVLQTSPVVTLLGGACCL